MAGDPRYHAESIDFDQGSRLLSIIWGDGHRSDFPFIWLRHARMFPLMGRAEQLNQETYQLPDDPVTMTIDSTRVDGEELNIRWASDIEPTLHNLVFLRNHCLSDSARHERRPGPKLWDAETARGFEWFDALVFAVVNEINPQAFA